MAINHWSICIHQIASKRKAALVHRAIALFVQNKFVWETLLTFSKKFSVD
jgi:hypothetical protein